MWENKIPPNKNKPSPDLLCHFEELIGFRFPDASYELLEIPYQTTSSTWRT